MAHWEKSTNSIFKEDNYYLEQGIVKRDIDLLFTLVSYGYGIATIYYWTWKYSFLFKTLWVLSLNF
jgi:hypothetical protein